MNNLFIAILLSIAPISELRGGIPYGIGFGYNPILVFALCTLANILIIVIIFLFLDYLHETFMKITLYRKLMDRVILRTKKKIESKVGSKWETLALYLLVAIPLPGTGAYTGCLAAWLFKLNRKKSMLAISLGVLTAGIIITLVSTGVLSLVSQ
ncbi:MAG: small multi-drug export protein [archaeon]